VGRTTRRPQAKISVSKAAELLKCSKRHVWRLAKTGYLAKVDNAYSYDSVVSLAAARSASTCMTPTEMSIRLNNLERRVSLLERGHTVKERVVTPTQSMEVRAALRKLHPDLS